MAATLRHRTKPAYPSDAGPSSKSRRLAMSSVSPLISTTLFRLVAPVTRTTSRRRTPKAPATARNAASVALPSTAGAGGGFPALRWVRGTADDDDGARRAAQAGADHRAGRTQGPGHVACGPENQHVRPHAALEQDARGETVH